ncbi:S-adenosyl-L-methionine-dependent methyltransferase [Phytophthora cactorum]|nr:S-adenosyl-L-methionine-dependent methyltransferase [Phytophthora cactorum]
MAMASFSILESVTSNITKSVAPLLSGKMQRNSVACLEFGKQNAPRNNPESVVTAIDTFAASNPMINVGAGKGSIVDAEIRQEPWRKSELTRATTLCALPAPSAKLPKRLVSTPTITLSSIRPSSRPVRVRYVEEKCLSCTYGLVRRVERPSKIIEGAFSDQLPFLKERPSMLVTVTLHCCSAESSSHHLSFLRLHQIYYIGLDKSLYVSDAEKIIASGTLQPGSLLVADNVLIPGAPEYLTFVDEHPQLKSVLHRLVHVGQRSHLRGNLHRETPA